MLLLARRTEARWEFFSAWLPTAELLGSSPAAVSLASALLMKLLAAALPGSLPLLLASCYCVDIVLKLILIQLFKSYRVPSL